MVDKEKYVIKIQGDLVEVSKDVYYAYFRMERQERWQEEKQKKHNIVSYDAMDTSETVGAEAIADMVTPSVEEIAIANDIKNRLHHAVVSLPKAERELIQAIYFDGISEREYATLQGITQTGVNKQRRKTLSKMKLAAVMYEAIDSREYETYRMRRVFEKEQPRSELDKDLIVKNISAVLVDSNGTVKIKLKNEQIIEGGE